MAVLSFDSVVKRFGDFTAVDGLSFEVPEGGVFGFLGGNGAGKTTSLRMALDILRPSGGRFAVLGGAPGRERAADIGFLPEERGLYRRMTVLDTVVYFGRLKGMSARDARRSAGVLIDRFGLAQWADQPVSKLSKGMSQKVQVATAVVNQPRLLILDEPFSGLDPVNQAVLEAMVLETAGSGATVIFSTHVMQHAERLCDRLLLMARGRLVFQGDVEAARDQLPVRLLVTSRCDPSQLPGVVSAVACGPMGGGWTDYELAVAPGVRPEDLLEMCTAQGFALRRFEPRRASLHEVFLHLVGPSAPESPT
jgi:ABC-2 type transport system ATP-binding protein